MNKKIPPHRIRGLACLKWMVLLLIGFLFLAGFAGVACAWIETTHKNYLTKMALELIREETEGQEYTPEIWEEFSRFILQGSHDEDFPCEFFGEREAVAPLQWLTGLDRFPSPIRFDLRANNHYGHGIVPGVGLTCSALDMGDPDTDPLNWAKTNLPFNPEEEFKGGEYWDAFRWTPKDLDAGNMSWKNAIDRYGYTSDSKELAYYTLGFILHLLQDMGEPEHVHDDPHGGSSFTGFERYMEDHWLEIRPEIRSLKPWRPEANQPQPQPDKDEFFADTSDYFDLLKRKKGADEEKVGPFADINEYFTRLGKIAYSATRFKGFVGNKPADPPKIEKGSDLELMFDVEEVEYRHPRSPAGESEVERGWVLKNKKAPMSHGPLWYLPETYGKKPAGHKGGEDGSWWPTSRELENLEKDKKADAEGYYYIELSLDLPYQELGKAAYNRTLKKGFGTMDLYPVAYLPSPLEEVKKECQVWRRNSLDGRTHLYQILAKNLTPYLVQFSAGLAQHYFDIVNPPPYVKTVLVFQADKRYDASWEDRTEVRAGTDTVRDVKARTLLKETTKPLQPGRAFISVFFSEPVQKPTVTVGSLDVPDLKPDRGDTSWSGFFEIPEKGPTRDSLKIFIGATDRNRHYGDEGGQLDAFPETPATRRVWKNGYRWQGYSPAKDENHSLQVVRYPTEVTVRNIKPIVSNMAEVNFQEDEATQRGQAPQPLRVKAGQAVNLDIELVVFGPPGKPVEVTINPSLIGWARFSSKTPPPLRLESIKRTIEFGQEEFQKVERAILSFPIHYPTRDERANSFHDFRLELAVNGKWQKPLIISDAFDVGAPGTDFGGTGDLGICVRLPENDVDKEAFMGEFYRGKVKVSLYPISGMVAPAPKILSDACLSEIFASEPEGNLNGFLKIPLGRYRVVAELLADTDYKGPRRGSTVVTLFKWNPEDRHAGRWNASIQLGKAEEERRPDFVEQSISKNRGASGAREWFVHVKVVDQNKKGISGARVFTQEGHMEAKDQGRGEYLLGPIKNVEDSTLKHLTLVADIASRLSPDVAPPQPQTEFVWLQDRPHVYAAFQFLISVPPAFVSASKVRKSEPSGTEIMSPTPPTLPSSQPPVVGKKPGSSATSGTGTGSQGPGGTTAGGSTTSRQRKDRCQCVRLLCSTCKELLFCTSNDPDCLACINANETAIRQCMEEES